MKFLSLYFWLKDVHTKIRWRRYMIILIKRLWEWGNQDLCTASMMFLMFLAQLLSVRSICLSAIRKKSLRKRLSSVIKNSLRIRHGSRQLNKPRGKKRSNLVEISMLLEAARCQIWGISIWWMSHLLVEFKILFSQVMRPTSTKKELHMSLISKNKSERKKWPSRSKKRD